MGRAKDNRGYWRAVALQTLVILDGVAALTAGGIWLTRPYWEAVEPPPVTAPQQWGPTSLGDTGCWCWRPMEWTLRYSKDGDREEWQLEAGVGARLVLVAEKETAKASPEEGKKRVEGLMKAMGTWYGFGASEPEAAETALGTGYAARFAYSQVGGLRVLPWGGWAWAGRSEGRAWTACATFPEGEWKTFSPAAWQVLETVRPAKQKPPPPPATAADEQKARDEENE